MLIAVGLVLSYLNPFGYFTIFGTKINPFAHFINALSGVLIGLTFSVITATSIATLRFSLNIGTIHAFHGGISGAVVVGIVSYILRKLKPKYVDFAALVEPIGTVFIGGTIGYFVVPVGPLLEGLIFYWGLFAASCIPGSIMGFILLKVLKRAGISWRDFFNNNHKN
ncbi:MAG: energy coupling factor transporter S component ThiW [Candidatus Lokiarchaeota archaeon]